MPRQHDGVEPDGVMLGKALGGGLIPVLLLLARRELMGVFSPGDHGSAFGGNPIAAERQACGRSQRSAALVLCFHAVRQYQIAWRSTASAGKFDFSSRTGKTHFPDADFFRGREKTLSVRPRAVRTPERA